MFFHIDEAGNTGNNLFDDQQPKLSYGVLLSCMNVDALGRKIHKKMLQHLDVKDLHANHLGVEKLSEIAPLLKTLQSKLKFDFDYYFIDKKTFALVIFFEAVFDAGLNEAVRWDTYWTPLRYPMIFQLSKIMNDDLLKRAWSLCMHKRIENQPSNIVELLQDVREQCKLSSLDRRSKEIIQDALNYGISNPLELDFGNKDKNALSPNTIGFQFVVSCIASRLSKKRKECLGITVDQQSQFNGSQIKTHDVALLISNSMKTASKDHQEYLLNHPIHFNLDKDVILRKGVPDKSIHISSSEQSIGLQIVDVYLWITNRMLDGKSLSKELHDIGRSVWKRSKIDGISMDFMARRWSIFERQLPNYEDLTPEQMQIGQEMIDTHRQKVAEL